MTCGFLHRRIPWFAYIWKTVPNICFMFIIYKLSALLIKKWMIQSNVKMIILPTKPPKMLYVYFKSQYFIVATKMNE